MNGIQKLREFLNEFQREQVEWSTQNFASIYGSGYRPLLGIGEEVGELMHAHLKAEQGIRIDQDHQTAKIDAAGDIIIYLSDYCNTQGIKLGDALVDTWEKTVKKRDWQVNKTDGTP